MDFKKSFCLSSSLKIMTLFLLIPGLKTRVKNDIFFSLKQGQDLGDTHPPKIPGNTPTPFGFQTEHH